MTESCVLVVDDEFGVVEVLEAALHDHGYLTMSAHNGRQALARLAERTPDLVIADYMMPIMNGRHLLQAMAESPEFSTIPVILMSALEGSAITGLALAPRAFVRKPFHIVAVLELVSAVLKRPL